MAKNQSRFVCQECGSIYARWSGHCDACSAWNTIVEETPQNQFDKKKSKTHGVSFVPLDGAPLKVQRINSGMDEFDRVCGGGLVPSSVLLVGGDPGIGKSTLLLQILALLSQQLTCAYISGEEAIDQVRMRAQRLGISHAPIQLASSTNIGEIMASIDVPDGPKVVVIDSIQTMYFDQIDASPGTVSQVRACTTQLIHAAKKRGFILVLVGHVTKEGTLAGPRVLEHMVDAVLYFEGERSHQFRIIRTVKNRFGPCDEIGVFEMVESGLQEVKNPSALFLSHRDQNVTGSTVFAGIEGTRPILCEIQALVAPSTMASPRRTVVGWDPGRLAMILAVLEARCGIPLSNKEVYLNVAGGLKINEPAADLAVAMALLSSFSDIPLNPSSVVFGEIGLSGEVRPVSLTELRLKEAEKLGFQNAFIPVMRKEMSDVKKIVTFPLSHLAQGLDFFDLSAKI